MHFIHRTYIPDGRVYLGNVKYMMKMISDYAYTGPIGITVNMLLEHQSQIRTYYYQYGYSGSQSLCDKQVYYGWRYSIKLQLQNLGLGMDFFIYGQSCYIWPAHTRPKCGTQLGMSPDVLETCPVGTLNLGIKWVDWL